VLTMAPLLQRVLKGWSGRTSITTEKSDVELYLQVKPIDRCWRGFRRDLGSTGRAETGEGAKGNPSDGTQCYPPSLDQVGQGHFNPLEARPRAVPLCRTTHAH
jgi:hypothetical protein